MRSLAPIHHVDSPPLLRPLRTDRIILAEFILHEFFCARTQRRVLQRV
jgi:hypothetical protein